MATPHDPLIFVRDIQDPEDSRQRHARATIGGLETRVAHGVYVADPDWARLDALSRYLLVIRAIAETRRNRPVISHLSAAALHGLPIVGDWPATVHVTQAPTATLRSRSGITRHSLPLADGDVVEVRGMLVTSVARTVLDLAVTMSFSGAIIAADAALKVDPSDRFPPLVTMQELFAAWSSRLPFRGYARAREVVGFAVTGAETPIESISRVSMRAIGCPVPVLQQPFYDAAGFIARTDFSFPQHGVVGEADGDSKYLDASKRSGRSVKQVLLDEKIREDRLRALPKRMARWRWSVGMNPAALRTRLQAVGLPMGIKWPRAE
jgi:hypothetical protein